MAGKLTGHQRTYLRGLAHRMRAGVIVGTKGVTNTLIKALDDELERHELVKLRFGEFKEEKKTLAVELEKKTNSEMVGMVGNTAVYFRQQPDPEKRSVELPKKRKTQDQD